MKIGVNGLIEQRAFNISILTKIEFLGWDKHTKEGFEKCNQLIALANIFPVDEVVGNKAIELKRTRNIKLADAVLAATALVHEFKLSTRNIDDFKSIEGLKIVNPID